MSSAPILALLLAFAIALTLFVPPAGAQSAASGFQAVAPSVFQVWPLDAKGQAIASGTAFVVQADGHEALLLTAAHVVRGSNDVRIDFPGDRSRKVTVVARDDGRDIALLSAPEPNLKPLTISGDPLSVGETTATAGYLRSETGAASAHLLYPGTISATLQNGRILEFDNLNVQEGLSGGPLFDPVTGTVLGMVVSRISDKEVGGYALSAQVVLIGYLTDRKVAFSLERPGSRIPNIARVLTPVKGNVGTRSADGTFTKSTTAFILPDDANVATQEDSNGLVRLPDTSEIGLGPGTVMQVGASKGASAPTVLTLKSGTVRFNLRHPGETRSTYIVKTPNLSIEVHGTVGLLSTGPKGDVLACLACDPNDVVVTVAGKPYQVVTDQTLVAPPAGPVVVAATVGKTLGDFGATGLATSAAATTAFATGGAGAGGGALILGGLGVLGLAAAAGGGGGKGGGGTSTTTIVNNPAPVPTPSPTPTPLTAPGTANVSTHERRASSPGAAPSTGPSPRPVPTIGSRGGRPL